MLEGLPVLVTGATGKVGALLVPALLERGVRVSVLTRRPERVRALWPSGEVEGREADLTVPATLPDALSGISCVLHLASYSPAPDEPDIYEAPSHWPVTAEGTENLARAAREAGAERLVYLSSVKAMGDAAGATGKPADEDTPPAPESLYGRAKLAAERSILAASSDGAMHVCVLRLPMVYGIAGAGNIARMIAAVARGRFPPWPRISNRRSAIHIADVIDATLLAAVHPQAAGRTYLVTDGAGYSTRWLYEQIRRALGRKVPGWTVPYPVLRAAAETGTLLERLSGRRMPLDREGLGKLTGDAWFSSERIRDELGFRPRHNLEQEIPRMVREYVAGG
jgi:nucleoside-diphosphate-sugar epimerase